MFSTMDVIIFFTYVVLFATATADAHAVGDFLVDLNSGKAQTYCGLQIDEKIVGGTETRRKEFPWVAALEYVYTANQKNAGIQCGGSVVSERYIITAAHCIRYPGLEMIKAWVGVWKISEAGTVDKDKVQKLDIEEQIRHEDYNNPVWENDVGLLRLADDIKFSDYVRPLCLPKQNLPLPEPGTIMSVAGWGRIYQNAKPSDVKLKVEVPLVSNEECSKMNNLTISDNQLCAGRVKLEGTCQGDSGGPLMLNFTDSGSGNIYWYQTGIVSFSRGCAYENYPGVYTRMSSFIDWIASNVK